MLSHVLYACREDSSTGQGQLEAYLGLVTNLSLSETPLGVFQESRLVAAVCRLLAGSAKPEVSSLPLPRIVSF